MVPAQMVATKVSMTSYPTLHWSYSAPPISVENVSSNFQLASSTVLPQLLSIVSSYLPSQTRIPVPYSYSFRRIPE
jgi:hypothetical protein